MKRKENSIICFHHNDADGRCAGAIVHRKYPDCMFVEMNYDRPVPFGMIEKGEIVYIVDFSFKPDDMNELFKITNDVVWIDHHKTILDHPYNDQAKVAGIRDIKHSGAYLTWEYVYPKYNIPTAVRLISDYDTWTLAMSESTKFRFGLDLHPHQPDDLIWNDLLGSGSTYVDTVCGICREGETVLRFIDKFGQDYIKSYGFETDFEGFKCIAQGVYNFGSTFYGDLIDKYDICIAFEFNGDNWIVGLYSVKTDVSVIAKKHGGGGHKGAAGFVCKELPFRKKGANGHEK